MTACVSIKRKDLLHSITAACCVSCYRSWHQTFSFTNVKAAPWESLPSRKKPPFLIWCVFAVRLVGTATSRPPRPKAVVDALITKLLRLFRGHQGNKPLKSGKIFWIRKSSKLPFCWGPWIFPSCSKLRNLLMKDLFNQLITMLCHRL